MNELPQRPRCNHRIGPEQSALSDRIWRDYRFNMPCAHVSCHAGIKSPDLMIEKVGLVSFWAAPTRSRALFRRENVIYTDDSPTRRVFFRPCFWPSWESIEWAVVSEDDR